MYLIVGVDVQKRKEILETMLLDFSTNERRLRPCYRICLIDEGVREIRDDKCPPPNERPGRGSLNPLKPELNPIFYLLAILGAHHFLHVSRIRVKLLTF